jgi:hypothetical protein
LRAIRLPRQLAFPQRSNLGLDSVGKLCCTPEQLIARQDEKVLTPECLAALLAFSFRSFHGSSRPRGRTC